MPPPAIPARIAAEPFEVSQEVLRQSCIQALCSLGEYAPEIEPGDTRAVSAELLRLSRAISQNFSEEEGLRVQAGVRAALQAHREHAQARLGQMRQQVETAQAAIREFAAAIPARHATYQGSVQQELATLKTAAQTSDLTRIRGALDQACAGIRSSHAEFVYAQQLVTLQLLDEIRVLRDTVEAHQREPERDPKSGVQPRQRIDSEIRTRLARMEAFSVLVFSMHNLGRLQAEHPPATILSLFEAFRKRLSVIVGSEVMLARWSPSSFALLLSATGARAEAIRERVCSQLPEAFTVQAGGTTYTLRLDLSIDILDPVAEYRANP